MSSVQRILVTAVGITGALWDRHNVVSSNAAQSATFPDMSDNATVENTGDVTVSESCGRHPSRGRCFSAASRYSIPPSK